MSSESEDDAIDDLEFEEASEPEHEIDEDILGALEEDLQAEASEVDEVWPMRSVVANTHAHRVSCGILGLGH